MTNASDQYIAVSQSQDAWLGTEIPQWITDSAARYEVPVSDAVRVAMNDPDRLKRFNATQLFFEDSMNAISQKLADATTKLNDQKLALLNAATAQAAAVQAVKDADAATIKGLQDQVTANTPDPAVWAALNAALAS